MKGVPVRLEIGPKDIEKKPVRAGPPGQPGKRPCSAGRTGGNPAETAESRTRRLVSEALARRETMTYSAAGMEEMKDLADNKPGFIKAMWCGDLNAKWRSRSRPALPAAVCPLSRSIADTCVCCGKPAKHMVVWGKRIDCFRNPYVTRRFFRRLFRV